MGYGPWGPQRVGHDSATKQNKSGELLKGQGKNATNRVFSAQRTMMGVGVGHQNSFLDFISDLVCVPEHLSYFCSFSFLMHRQVIILCSLSFH